MRILLAKLFRVLFKIKYIRNRFFGIYKRIFKPFNLFKEVICKVLYEDFKLILHIDDWIQQNIYFLGEYEKAELKTLGNFLSANSVFIDLGANFGLYTLYASKLVGENGKVISFEPFGENFKSLTRNIEINKLANVLAEKLAVGEKEGTIHLYCDIEEKNLGMVSANYIENAYHEQVSIVSLDTYFDNKSIDRIDFIKIDIEGFEYPALLGMKNLLVKFHPTLLIEILNNEESTEYEEKIFNYLNNLGYKKYFIDDKGNLSDRESNHKRMNYLFTIKTIT